MIKREKATLLSMLQVLLLLYYPGFKVIDLKIFSISDYRCLDKLESCELTVLHASALLSLAIAWSKKKKKQNGKQGAPLAPKVKEFTLKSETAALPLVNLSQCLSISSHLLSKALYLCHLLGGQN